MQAGDETLDNEPGAQIEFIELRYELIGKILLFIFCHLFIFKPQPQTHFYKI